MTTLPAPTVKAIGKALEGAKRCLVITHVGPDGDAIASLTAFGLALKQLDKQFSLVCDDSVPGRYSFLPLTNRVRKTPERVEYDLIVALDAGDLERLGRAYSGLNQRPPIINIDHHITNTRFGSINLVVPNANATTEILLELFEALNLELSRELAIALLTGLVTDTLAFRTAGVTAETLRAASKLVEAGADLFEVTLRGLSLKQLSTLLVWEKGLGNMKMEGGLLWTSISNAEREEAGHNGASTYGLGNLLADVYQADMSAVLLEQADGRVTVGFRCRPPFSVAELALSLGGGGHPLAAGCTLDGPLEKVRSLVISRSKQALKEQRASFSGNGQSRPGSD